MKKNKTKTQHNMRWTSLYASKQGFHWKGGVCACITGSCAIFALVGSFHRKWRHQTSRDPKGFPWKGGVRAYATRSCAISDQTSPVGLLWKYGSPPWFVHDQLEVRNLSLEFCLIFIYRFWWKELTTTKIQKTKKSITSSDRSIEHYLQTL